LYTYKAALGGLGALLGPLAQLSFWKYVWAPWET